ncbi:MAG TPA: EAL domain-containing protein [Hyphomonadaceae bacterium]|nr:EAL domain-containing protein [Hyphomonadaceae bacterium]
MPAKPPKTTENRKRRRLGLAGRVALIACGTAVAATIVQWVVTPGLLRHQFDAARLNQAHASAEQLALLAGDDIVSDTGADLEKMVERMGNPLPGGGAAILHPDGRIWAANKRGADVAHALTPAGIPKREASFTRGEARIGIYPIRDKSETIGFAMISMEPQGLIGIWFQVLAYCALVFALVLTVFAFFLFPLARRALSPVTELERRIRKRDPKDKSKLADSSDDRVLKPLLAAIDEVHDRSEAAMKRALALAYTDPVTRLPNRLRLLSKLEALVDRGQGQLVHFGICDLDGFRKVNVDHGPRVADGLLATVAERLRACASQSAGQSGLQLFIGRIGADQFGIIAPGMDQAGFKGFLAAAEQLVAEPITFDDTHIRISARFGAAAAPEDAATASDLLKQAEIALKEAKRQLTSRRAFFDQRLLDRAKAQQKLEAELREGLERGEFVAVFQPKVKLETGELVGAEALARWRRPDGSVVSPGVFVPMAEELGLISKLGHSVMRDACFAAAGWNKKGIVSSVAVNVSPHQFEDPDFIKTVYQALDDSGLSPDLLELEITESAAVADPERVARTMWPLRNRGVRLAIDDFGTGHSNFASITRLPFDVFKIDQQFVRALSTDPHAPAIVEMILAMAEALGQETVAEGVETREQADFLLRRACTIGQGYYYSPPLPAEEFDMFVRSWRPRPADKFAA